MKNKALYRKFFIVLVVSLIWLMVGCDQSGQITATGSKKGKKPSGQDQTNRLAPHNGSDAVHYSDLLKKLKPVTRAKRSYRLGIILKYSGNPYYQNLADGMHDRAKELGLLTYFQAGITESDHEGQRAVFEDALDKGYDAILISPQTDTNLTPSAHIAKERGIPLINIDDALLSDADYYIGPDHYESGVMAANYFVNIIDRGGKIAVIQGYVGDYGVEQQNRGFEDTLRGKSFQVVARPFCIWDLQIAFQEAAAILSKYPDLKGFYCNNDIMALGVAQAVKEAGKTGEVIVVGRDGIDLAHEAIGNKEMEATIDTSAFEMGKIAVELTVRILEGQDINRVVLTPQKLITQKSTDVLHENNE